MAPKNGTAGLAGRGRRSDLVAGQADSAAPAYWKYWEWRDALLDALARRKISKSAFAVGIALATFADNRTGESRPSIAGIARRVGMAVSKDDDCPAVRALLKSLEREGLIEINQQGHMKPNLYLPRFPQREFKAEDDRPKRGDMTAPQQGGYDGGDRLKPGGMTASNQAANYSTELSNYQPYGESVAHAGGSSTRSTSLSLDKPLSEPDLEAAIAAGLTESQAASEWRAFVDFNLDRASRSFNWSAKWRFWLYRSKSFKSSGNENNVHAAAKRLHDELLARQSIEMFRPPMLPDPSR
jgi:hypothetical protein